MKKIKILFFCLGNICRSPIAEAVFRYKVEQRGLTDFFEIDSAGTSDYHMGETPHQGSQKVVMERLGLDITYQKSRCLEAKDLHYFDYLIAMDESNVQAAKDLGNGCFYLMRQFEDQSLTCKLSVPDPWGYDSKAYDEVYDIIDRCSDRLLDYIVTKESIKA